MLFKPGRPPAALIGHDRVLGRQQVPTAFRSVSRPRDVLRYTEKIIVSMLAIAQREVRRPKRLIFIFALNLVLIDLAQSDAETGSANMAACSHGAFHGLCDDGHGQ